MKPEDIKLSFDLFSFVGYGVVTLVLYVVAAVVKAWATNIVQRIMVKKNLAADYNGGSPAFVQSPSATVPVCGLHPSMMLELDRIHKILDSGGEEFKEIGERITALSMKVGEFIAVSNQRIETVEAYIKDYIKFSHKGQQ